MFHSSVSSKFRNLSRVMMSLAVFTRVSAPSTTCQPGGTESRLYPRHPAVVLPSNSRRQPAERSAAVNVLSAAGPLAVPACCAKLGRGAAVRAAAAQAASSRIRVTRVMTGFTSPPRLVGNSSQLLDTRLHGASSALALGNDEDRVVARNRADDLRPPGRVERQAECLRAAGGRLHHEQRTDAIDGDQHGGGPVPPGRPGGRPPPPRRRGK